MKKQHGFSLVEMAIVLLILGLLIGGLIGPISNQIEAARIKESQAQLNTVQDALFGYAATYGSLPCPATLASAGQEASCTSAPGVGACGAVLIGQAAKPAHGRCALPYSGFLPGQQLGLAPLDASGRLLDSWGNPIRYAVAPILNAAGTVAVITANDGIRNMNVASGSPPFGIAGLGSVPSGPPFLHVCQSATGISVTDCGPAPNRLTDDSVAVFYSTGRNTGTGGTGLDEGANPNPNSANIDAVFVWHFRTDTGASNGEFDDIMQWLPRSLLVNKLVTAGRLP